MQIERYGRTTVMVGDARESLRKLPAGSVQTIVTSPPYWALRDYDVEPLVWGADPECDHDWLTAEDLQLANGARKKWSHGAVGMTVAAGMPPRISSGDTLTCSKCGAWIGSLGLEPDFMDYIDHVLEVFDECWRVPADDGTMWVNMGDSYANGGSGSRDPERWPKQSRNDHRLTHLKKRTGLRPKNLLGIPWRLAFGLQERGWYLRCDVIWNKRNPMPESVNDRPTRAHEYLFLLSKAETYYYDADAIKEPVSESTHARLAQNVEAQIGSARTAGGNKVNGNMKAVVSGSGRKLADRNSGIKSNTDFVEAVVLRTELRNKRSVWTLSTQAYSEGHFATFPPKLVEPCVLAGSRPGDIVLDPFGGTGTTAGVAVALDRRGLLCELSPEYSKLIPHRLDMIAGSFLQGSLLEPEPSEDIKQFELVIDQLKGVGR